MNVPDASGRGAQLLGRRGGYGDRDVPRGLVIDRDGRRLAGRGDPAGYHLQSAGFLHKDFRVGIGVSSNAGVRFRDVKLTELPDQPLAAAAPHTPRFSMRRWLGGRPWVFDGDEPIMLLPAPESSTRLPVVSSRHSIWLPGTRVAPFSSGWTQTTWPTRIGWNGSSRG